MRKKGTHTYDVFLMYHHCPKCGYIIESRTDYQPSLEGYYKQLECIRCGHPFILEKKSNTKPTY